MDVSITTLVLITLEVFLPLVSGCSPEFYEPPTLNSKTQRADIIVVGKVTNIIDTGIPQPIGNIYKAEVRVKCIYKGGNYQIPKKITIGEAGISLFIVSASPDVIKLLSCSTQLSMKFFLPIYVKMPTIVGTCPNDFSDPIDQDIRTQGALSWKIVVSEWRSVNAVSLNVGGGVRLIKPAKPCMCTQNTTNITRTDTRRRVCAAIVPYR